MRERRKPATPARLTRLLLFFFVFQLCALGGVMGPAEAVVRLTPRVDGGVVRGGEDHVYFGNYRHLNGYANGNWWEGNEYEAAARPILWRVMETGAGAATLLSHYLLETNHYHQSNDGNDWEGSRMQQFLNSDADQFQTYELGYDALDPQVPGFLHASRFSSAERTAMRSPSPDGITSSVVTLASKEEVNGGWFVFTTAANPSRQAGTVTESLGSESYWLRSPSTTKDDEAWNVDHNGGASEYQAFNPLGVRPVFSLDLGAVLFKASSADVFGGSVTAAGGSLANPFVLFLPGLSPYNSVAYASEDLAPTSAIMNGGTLALDFGRSISPAVRSWPAAGDFTLRRSGGQTMAASAVRSSSTTGLVLTFPAAVGAGESLMLDYNLNHDAVSFDSVPIAKVMAGRSGIAVVNATESGGEAERPSSATRPGKVAVVLNEQEYEAVRQEDGRYLILLPAGTPPSTLQSLPLEIALPTGATISPDLAAGVDFTGGPAAFIITAEDGRTKAEILVEVNIRPAESVELAMLLTAAARCRVFAAYNADGTLAAEIRLPFADGFDPAVLNASSYIYARLSGLANLSFSRVDGEGNATPLPRGAEGAYLRIAGTAANRAALEAASLSLLTYRLEGDETEYRQTFSPALKLAEMQIAYTNEPQEENGGGGSSGCDAGAGLALGLTGLMALPLLGGRRRR